MCALAGLSRPDQPQYMHSILLVALWLMNASQSQFACVRTFGLLLLLLLLCLCSSDGPLILWMIAHVLFPPLCPQNNSQPARVRRSVSDERVKCMSFKLSTRGVWRLSSLLLLTVSLFRRIRDVRIRMRVCLHVRNVIFDSIGSSTSWVIHLARSFFFLHLRYKVLHAIPLMPAHCTFTHTNTVQSGMPAIVHMLECIT